MSDLEPIPRYRVDGDVAWYDHFLPNFRDKSFIALVNEMTGRPDKVRILDLGAGDFTFAIGCHTRWLGKVEMTGVSSDSFLLPDQKKFVTDLGISICQIQISQVQKRLPSNFQLAVSVLTNIYDSQTDYVGVMWQMLADEGVGLLDNLPVSSEVNIVELASTLHFEGYQVEIQNMQQLLPDQIKHAKPPIVKPAPKNQQFIYLTELKQLQNEQSKPHQGHAIPITAIAFQKDNRKANLGSRILELTRK